MSDNTASAALTVRPGVADDYAAVLDIQRRAYTMKEAPLYGPDLPPLQETPETLVQEAKEGKLLLVGVRSGRVVASLRTKKLDDGSVYWCRLSVDPDLMGNGIGQQMIHAVEERNPDAPALVLDCGENSAENMHIYSKMGYRTTGEAYQVPNGPRVLVMRKERKP